MYCTLKLVCWRRYYHPATEEMFVTKGTSPDWHPCAQILALATIIFFKSDTRSIILKIITPQGIVWCLDETSYKENMTGLENLIKGGPPQFKSRSEKTVAQLIYWCAQFLRDFWVLLLHMRYKRQNVTLGIHLTVMTVFPFFRALSINLLLWLKFGKEELWYIKDGNSLSIYDGKEIRSQIQGYNGKSSQSCL